MSRAEHSTGEALVGLLESYGTDTIYGIPGVHNVEMYRALPRSTYTDPEASSVGLTLDQAKAAGIDAVEYVADFATSSKGYAVEAEFGHVTVTFDRASRQMIGAAMACPDASAAIHECVLAIRARVPVEILADTIHAFPSTSRIFNGLFAEAAKDLGPG